MKESKAVRKSVSDFVREKRTEMEVGWEGRGSIEPIVLHI